MSPRKATLMVVLGIVIGIMPVIWGATVLCALLAFRFGLNQPGIQAVNYLAYPIQITLFIPFYRLGAWLFPWGPTLTAKHLLTDFKQTAIANSAAFIPATLKAIGAWLIVAPPTAGILYLALLPVITRMIEAKMNYPSED